MGKIGFFFNKKNIEFNFDKFGRNKKVLYVTGLSGSGKTSTSIELADKYHSNLFELDNLGGFFGEYKNSTEIIHILTGEFLQKHPDLEHIIRTEAYVRLKIQNFEEYKRWTKLYVEFLKDYAYNHDGLFIFEGTQIFKCIDAKKFADDPILIIGTSSFISMIRRIKRHYRLDKKKNKKGFFKKHLWKLLNDSKRLHFKDFIELNEFLKKCEKNQRDDKI